MIKYTQWFDGTSTVISSRSVNVTVINTFNVAGRQCVDVDVDGDRDVDVSGEVDVNGDAGGDVEVDCDVKCDDDVDGDGIVMAKVTLTVRFNYEKVDGEIDDDAKGYGVETRRWR